MEVSIVWLELLDFLSSTGFGSSKSSSSIVRSIISAKSRFLDFTRVRGCVLGCKCEDEGGVTFLVLVSSHWLEIA